MMKIWLRKLFKLCEDDEVDEKSWNFLNVLWLNVEYIEKHCFGVND